MFCKFGETWRCWFNFIWLFLKAIYVLAEARCCTLASSGIVAFLQFSFLLHLSFLNVNIIFKFLQPQNWQHSRLYLRTFKFGYLTF